MVVLCSRDWHRTMGKASDYTHTLHGDSDLGHGYGALQRYCASEVYHRAGGSAELTGVGRCTFKILGCRRQELAARGHSRSA